MNHSFDTWWTVLWDAGVLAMGILGPERTYIHVNAALCHLLQTDPATMTAWSYERVGHPLDLDAELDAFVRLSEGATSAVYTRRFRSARACEFTAEVRLCAGLNGQLLQIVCPGQTKVMAKGIEDAQQLDQRLEQLAAALSHDALEPLRQISVQAGILSERGAPLLDERGKKSLDTIERSALKAGRQLRGLIGFSRLGMPRIGPAPIRLRPLIDAAWSALANVPSSTSFIIEMDDALAWHCDPQQVTSALRELMCNALTFREPIRPLSVHLRASIIDDLCQISLSDNGRGIGAIDQPRLFRVFATVGSDAGVGVGLAIVRAVAKGHGGDATVTSEIGRGTQVTLTLAS